MGACNKPKAIRRKKMKRTIYIIGTTALLVSIAVVFAFAHGGMGWSGWDHHGQGWHHRGYYGSGYDDQMSKEQFKQFEQKREAFFKDTQDLRTKLYDKERELQKELSKDDPDAAKASGLQKEISELQSQLDQKRINHMVEMRKLAPNTNRGFMRGGPMMGYGPRSGGYCWQ
jgi:Spy/CpxP family protein refolding chaperone